MKTIILCGGFGTRLKEETEFKPKPLILVGGKPVLWHVMKIYEHYGYRDFILTLGYKGSLIKDYFLNERIYISDFTLNTSSKHIEYHTNTTDNFNITFVETGLESLTGERILRSSSFITEKNFMVTYGDGVADIDINDLIRFHEHQKTLATITGVHPLSKYGLITIDNSNLVTNFKEKPQLYDYVSGGFMIFKKEALSFFDSGPLENALAKLSKERQLSLYKHDGFWKAMDTYNEMTEMNILWNTKRPWAIWENKI